MSVYADTSFLVSLYTPDSNSAQASAEMRSVDGPVWLTPFGQLELTNAFELRRFRRELNVAEIRAAYSALRGDLDNGLFALRALPVTSFDKAGAISSGHTSRLGSRTLDVLHVASALTLGATDFYTFDRNQAKLAAALGLRILPC